MKNSPNNDPLGILEAEDPLGILESSGAPSGTPSQPVTEPTKTTSESSRASEFNRRYSLAGLTPNLRTPFELPNPEVAEETSIDVIEKPVAEQSSTAVPVNPKERTQFRKNVEEDLRGKRTDRYDISQIDPNNNPEQAEQFFQDAEEDYLDYLKATDENKFEETAATLTELRRQKANGDLSIGQQQKLRDIRNEAVNLKNTAVRRTLTQLQQSPEFAAYERQTGLLEQERRELESEMRDNPEAPGLNEKIAAFNQKQENVKKTSGFDKIEGQYLNAYDQYINPTIARSKNANDYPQLLMVDVVNKREKGEREKEAMEGNTEFFNAAGGTLAKGLLSVAQAPKIITDLFGATEYSAVDELYDKIEGVKKQGEGEFGELDNEDLPGLYKLSRLAGNTAGSIAMFAAGGAGAATRTGQLAATIGTSFLTTQADYYSDALAMGKSPKEAAKEASALAFVTSVAEAAVPDIKYFNPSAFRKSVINAMTSGKPFKEALKMSIDALPDATKAYLKSGAKEGGEEVLQQGVEDVTKEGINAVTDGEDYETFDANNYIQSFLGGFMGGAGMNVFSRPGPKPPDVETAMRDAVENREGIVSDLEAVDPEKAAAVDETLIEAQTVLDALKSHPEFEKLSTKDQNHLLAELQRKKNLEKVQKDIGVKDQTTEGEIAKIDEAVANKLGGVLETETEAIASDPATKSLNGTDQNQPVQETKVEEIIETETPVVSTSETVTEEPSTVSETNIVADEIQPEQPVAEDTGDNTAGSDSIVQEAPVEPEAEKPKPEKLSGIKKEMNSEESVRKANIERKTGEQLLEMGKSAIETGKINPQYFIADVLEKPRALQAEEIAAMVVYKVGLDKELSDAYDEINSAIESGDVEAQDAAKAKVTRLEKDIESYEIMSNVTGYEQGLSLNARKMILNSSYNLQDQIRKYKAKNEGVIPKDVEERMKDYSRRLEEADKKIEELQKEKAARDEQVAMENLIEETTVSKRKPTTKELSKSIADKIRKGKVTRPGVFMASSPGVVAWDSALEIAAQTVELGGSIIEATKKAVDYLRSTDFFKGLEEDAQKEAEKEVKSAVRSNRPKIEMVGDKVKIPTAIIRDLVSSGIHNIEDLSRAVLEEVKETNPDATIRDVMDAITGYGKEIRPTRDEVGAKVNAMKRMGRLISALEDVSSAKKPLKNSKQRQEQSDREKNLKKQLRQLMQEEFKEDFDQAKLVSYKERTKEKIKELNEKVKTGDFSRRARPGLRNYDQEALELEGQKVRAKEAYDYEFEKLRLSQRGGMEKAGDIIYDLLNAPKAVRATLDMSYPLRQGAIFMFTQNPKKSIKDIGQMYRFAYKGFDTANGDKAAKFLAKQENYDKWLSEVKASPSYPLMKASGLFIADENARGSAREEVFISGLLKKIPVMGTGPGLKPNSPTIAKVLWGANLSGASERGYAGLGNKMRVDNFLSGAQDLMDMGLSPQTDLDNFKAWAHFCNVATGRGKITSSEGINKALNLAYWSPRFISARLAIINPYFYYKMPPKVRKMALKKSAGFFGLMTTMLSMAWLWLNNDDDEETGVETNMLSSDFAKIKVGDVRIDPLAGFQQYFKAAAQMFMAQKKSTTTGEVKDFEGGLIVRHGTPIFELFTNKFAPLPGVLFKYGIAEEDKNGVLLDSHGNVLDMTDDLTDLGIPLYLSDVKELSKENGIPMTLFLAALSFHGEGVSSYGSVNYMTEEAYEKKIATYEAKHDGKAPSEDQKAKMMVSARNEAEREAENNKKARAKND